MKKLVELPEHMKGMVIEGFCNKCPFFTKWEQGGMRPDVCKAGGSYGKEVGIDVGALWDWEQNIIPDDCPLQTVPGEPSPDSPKHCKRCNRLTTVDRYFGDSDGPYCIPCSGEVNKEINRSEALILRRSNKPLACGTCNLLGNGCTCKVPNSPATLDWDGKTNCPHWEPAEIDWFHNGRSGGEQR